ncbi:MAG: beta-galactosidase [Gammaproteobacteria bacterium]
MKIKIILFSLTLFHSIITVANDELLIDFENYPIAKASPRDAIITPSSSNKQFIQLKTGAADKYPGISLPHPKSPGHHWNLKQQEYIEFTIKNTDTTTITLYFRVDNPPGTDGKKEPWITERASIRPGQTLKHKMLLRRKTSSAIDISDMDSYPQGLDPDGIRPTIISNLVIFLVQPSHPHQFEIGPVQAVGSYQLKPWETMSSKEFFPFIDEFGQFIHEDWPGKIASIETLRTQLTHEQKDLNSNKRAKNWDRYGGWKNGPKLKATGYFHTAKYNNKWWLVDPDGHLFWSHGVTTVKTSSGNTIITDRQQYFEKLPAQDGKTAFYNELPGHKVARGKFKNMESVTEMNFSQANYQKKYGNNWKKLAQQQAHLRLESWGMNTLGLWSSREITGMKKTPYVDWIYYWPPKIKGKAGHWYQLPDMWDPEFSSGFRKTAKNKLGRLKNDPWLIGLFVDNEIYWLDPLSFLANTLSTPIDQYAKTALIDLLKKKYKTIDSLNKQWKSTFGSWTALSENNQYRILAGAEKDALNFYRLSAEKYYKTIHDILHELAPNVLYLGSRLNGDFPIPAQAAAKYCDVISYNFYRGSINDFQVAGQLDKPVIVGEWHFGARDRGVFGSGLIAAENQRDRARKYRQYAEGAIVNPYIVGIHWFQYMDEMTTGRTLDGENHQIGFVSITDTPYKETISASREIGKQLYIRRAQ